METALIIAIAILIIGLLVVVLYFQNLIKQLTLNNDKNDNLEVLNFLKTDLDSLSGRIDKLKDSVSQSNLSVTEKLERSGNEMNQSVQRQLVQSSKLIADVTNRLTKLDETNARVVSVADELKTLQNVLQNPKQRGVFGEYYLENVLDNVLSPSQYQMQYRFKNGEAVDAVVFLDGKQVLPIDSKFSLENYNRLIEVTDQATKTKLLAAVRNDLKTRIDETSKYIRPAENTMEFAFMFIPSESLYYDLLNNKVGSAGSERDLVEYAFRDKHVIIVSPTSFMAYLQTVLQGLRSLQIEKQAKQIQIQVGKLGVHIKNFDSLLTKMGKSLSTTVNHYNNSYKELGKINKDVVAIADQNSDVLPEIIDRPIVD